MRKRGVRGATVRMRVRNPKVPYLYSERHIRPRWAFLNQSHGGGGPPLQMEAFWEAGLSSVNRF